MIIYTILNRKNNKCFTKTFDNPFQAEKYRRKLNYSRNYKIIRTIYDI